MLNVKVFNQEGAEVKDLELNEAVFGIEPHKQAMFDMVLLQRASLHIKLKTVLKLLVVEENHGVKKVQVELDKVQHVLHNGEVEELSSVLHQEVINSN